MKSELMHRSLRLATAQAYAASAGVSGCSWVQRAADNFTLDAPLDAAQASDADSSHGGIGGAGGDFQQPGAEICLNPIREEPHPFVVSAVQRFGLVGLLICAAGSHLLRWWGSIEHRSR